MKVISKTSSEDRIKQWFLNDEHQKLYTGTFPDIFKVALVVEGLQTFFLEFPCQRFSLFLGTTRNKCRPLTSPGDYAQRSVSLLLTHSFSLSPPLY